MAGVNWNKIKTEYITDPATSYRSLADKYKVSKNQIYAHGKEEGWPALRKQNMDRTVTEAVEAVKDSEVEAFAQLQRTANYLLQRLDSCAQAKSDEELDAYFRDYSVTLKNLRDVMQTPLDNRKKQAEIESLRKTLDDGEPEACEVVMDDKVKEYMV